MPESSPLTAAIIEKNSRDAHYQQLVEALSCSNLDDFYRVVVDTLPSALLIVEKDVVLVDYNAAATALLEGQREDILHKRLGEALHCIHSVDVPEGCGRGPHCDHCLVRQSVNHSLRGATISHQKLTLETLAAEQTHHREFWLTTMPLSYGERHYVLLMLETVPTLS